jgi:predicted enzyme related to lactoylglutathione lyase
MFRKIDCVMIRVADVPTAAKFYTEVFGLKTLWQDGDTVGLGLPETDAEIVLHNDPNIPSQVEVHYLVDDVVLAVETLRQNGCRIIEEPFDIAIGKCIVIRDPFGTLMCILDMSKGTRQQFCRPTRTSTGSARVVG